MIKLNHTYDSILLENFRFGLLYDSENPVSGVLWRNGVPTEVPVSSTRVSTGVYFLSFTTLGEADGWSVDDSILLRVTTTIDGQEYKVTKFDSLLVGGGGSGGTTDTITAATFTDSAVARMNSVR